MKVAVFVLYVNYKCNVYKYISCIKYSSYDKLIDLTVKVKMQPKDSVDLILFRKQCL